MHKSIASDTNHTVGQDHLEEILQTMLQAQEDLTAAKELLDGLEERLYFHGELKWRDVVGERAGLIAAHTDRRLCAISLLLELQKARASEGRA